MNVPDKPFIFNDFRKSDLLDGYLIKCHTRTPIVELDSQCGIFAPLSEPLYCRPSERSARPPKCLPPGIYRNKRITAENPRTGTAIADSPSSGT